MQKNTLRRSLWSHSIKQNFNLPKLHKSCSFCLCIKSQPNCNSQFSKWTMLLISMCVPMFFTAETEVRPVFKYYSFRQHFVTNKFL